MPDPSRPIIFATRGSPLALAQSSMVLAQCRAAFPQWPFELKIIKTTGDKLQAFAPSGPVVPEAGKGLFTKELEAALLGGEADLAVHSLKDLPTDLPPGLKLGAVSQRADPRDLLIYREADFLARDPLTMQGRRGLAAGVTPRDLPANATVATSSTRRQAQLLALRPDLRCVPIRGNVGTRLQKLADQPELDALVLAAAGLARLGFTLHSNGSIGGENIPVGLIAVHLSPDDMLPCVGQAALGIETRVNDVTIDGICAALDHPGTHRCVAAERAFLRAMGGGCLSPVAAYAEIKGEQLFLRAVSFRQATARRGELHGAATEAEEMGERLARELL